MSNEFTFETLVLCVIFTDLPSLCNQIVDMLIVFCIFENHCVSLLNYLFFIFNSWGYSQYSLAP